MVLGVLAMPRDFGALGTTRPADIGNDFGEPL